MKKILLINTGGTIASVKGKQGRRPAQTAAGLAAGLPLNFCELDFLDLLSLDSSDMHPKDWCVLAEKCADAYADYDGMVIAHGTDTLAYTAAALHYALPGIPRPVIITGSQIPIGEPESDAPGNLLDSLRVAAAWDNGVYVVFNGRIIDGNRASKVDSRAFDAFDSINAPLAGRVNAQGRLTRVAPPRPVIAFKPAIQFDPRVLLLKLYPGLNRKIIDWAVKAGYKAIIVEAFGLGGVAERFEKVRSALAEAAQSNVFVGLVSQCRRGGLDTEVYALSAAAKQSGLTPMGNLSSETALTQTMWKLAQGNLP